MISSHTLGEITLSVSTVVYIIWFLPQIFENFQRKSTQGLSLWMHGLLLLGYSADLLYGFGRHMQWQYRMVTIIGLLCLFVQHMQFARYSLKTNAEKWNFYVLTLLTIVVFSYAVLNFTVLQHGKKYYDIAGFISDACWATYMFPQIIKNFRLKSTRGLSIGFVAISIVLSFLDITSTFALHWDWPSIFSECVTLIKKSILVFQIVYYTRAPNLQKHAR